MAINVRISGAICGALRMPQVLAGKCGDWSITRERPRIKTTNGIPATIADTVDLILMENGGDFQNAEFAGDSLIIFEYRKPTEYGYEYHRRAFQLAECPSLAAYVNDDAYVSDFIDLA